MLNSIMQMKRDKVSTLMGHTEVRFTEITGEESSTPFVIIADYTGIRFEGKSSPLDTTQRLRELAKSIDAAWREHLKLKPQIARSLSGH